MKTIVKTSRLTGMLEKLFRMINADWFNNELDEPVITVTPTSRAYGHYSCSPIWTANGTIQKHEINISSVYLERDIDETVGTLMHEMCHYYNDAILNVQDCSSKGLYHNKHFRKTAEEHGLIVEKVPTYGYAHTHCSDLLLEWILEKDIPDIRMNRLNTDFTQTGASGKSGNRRGYRQTQTEKQFNPLPLPTLQRHCKDNKTAQSHLRRL